MRSRIKHYPQGRIRSISGGEPPADAASRSIDFPGGASDYVTSVNLVSGGIINWASAIGTIAGWARADATWATWRTIVGASDAGWGRGLAISYDGTNLRGWVRSWNTYYSTVAAPSVDAWFFYCLRFDSTGSLLKLTINSTTGSTTGTFNVAISPDTLALPFRWGNSSQSFGSTFQGQQRALTVWNTYASDAEVTAMYNGGSFVLPGLAKAGATLEFIVTEDDDPTAVGGIANTGSIGTAGDGSANLLLSTELPT